MLRKIRGPRTTALPWQAFLLGSIALLFSFLPTPAIEHASQPTAQASDAIYCVATDGDDSNPGTSTLPWRTLSKAALEAQAGDTVLIRGGEYREQLSPTHSGQPSAYITFKAQSGEQVVLRGNDSTDQNGVFVRGLSYIVFENLTVRGFQQGFGCQAPGHHIVVRRSVFENNLSVGISSSGHLPGTDKDCCDYLTIEDNIVRYNGYHLDGRPATAPGEGWGSGISLQPDSNPYVFDTDYARFHSVIRRNTVYHNYDGTGGDADDDADHSEGHGIIIDRGGNIAPLLIENNLIFGNGGVCIAPLGSQNVWIVGNTCYKNGTDPLFAPQDVQGEIIGFNSVTPIKNLHVLNNIAYAREGEKATLFLEVDPYQLDIRNNVWFGSSSSESIYPSPYGKDYVFADPQFVNPSIDPQVADFHLSPGSPAIGQGTSELPAGIQTDDHDGLARLGQGYYDPGAYRYVPPTPGPTSAVPS
jgi:hypothetical protein